jgi:hypothetical protein
MLPFSSQSLADAPQWSTDAPGGGVGIGGGASGGMGSVSGGGGGGGGGVSGGGYMPMPPSATQHGGPDQLTQHPSPRDGGGAAAAQQDREAGELELLPKAQVQKIAATYVGRLIGQERIMITGDAVDAIQKVPHLTLRPLPPAPAACAACRRCPASRSRARLYRPGAGPPKPLTRGLLCAGRGCHRLRRCL